MNKQELNIEARKVFAGLTSDEFTALCWLYMRVETFADTFDRLVEKGLVTYEEETTALGSRVVELFRD